MNTSSLQSALPSTGVSAVEEPSGAVDRVAFRIGVALLLRSARHAAAMPGRIARERSQQAALDHRASAERDYLLLGGRH